MAEKCLLKEFWVLKDCEICGNEIPDSMMTCRFCGGQQSAVPVSRARGRIRTINLKEGTRGVDDALVRLQCELERARSSGAKLVRVIHGWGSSGTGGALKSACHDQLRRESRRMCIAGYLPGEDYSTRHALAQEWLKRHPELASSLRSDSLNYGITLVEL